MKLSSDNVLWFIYQYNCSVGYPTVISKRVFEREFSMDWHQIQTVINNLIMVDQLVVRRFVFVYDLTEKGLQKVKTMEQNMPTDVMVTKRYWMEVARYLINLYDKIMGQGRNSLLLMLLGFTIPLNATTWYVAASRGNDANMGARLPVANATLVV